LELRRAEYRTYMPVPDQKGQLQFADKGGSSSDPRGTHALPMGAQIRAAAGRLR
jgi:hypothetical protein